jgi:flagellar biosynthetic protein FliP
LDTRWPRAGARDDALVIRIGRVASPGASRVTSAHRALGERGSLRETNEAQSSGCVARCALSAVLLIAAGAAAPEVGAQALPAITTTPAPGGGQTYSLTVQALLLLTSLTVLPALLLTMTSFTRIIIVLSLLRQALGTVHAPPNQVLVGLALFLTFFVMAPVFERIYQEAYVPLSERRIGMDQALDRAAVPLKGFMLRQTRQADLALFAKLADQPPLADADAVPMRVLLPAYVISELKTAFQIGFVVFIPFLIIDLVVGSVLMSMGMMMLSPVVISLPFKLMLFVLVDGWNLLVGSLVQSFYT